MLDTLKVLLAFCASVALCTDGQAAPAPVKLKPVPILVQHKMPVDPNNILVFHVQVGGTPIADETQSKYCFNLRGVEGSMTIDGLPGASARLDVYCGTVLMGSCEDIAPGQPFVKRCVIPKVEVTDETGKLTCTTTVIKGKPVVSVECDDP